MFWRTKRSRVGGEADKRGEYQRRDVRRMVGRFIGHFTCPITEISNAAINDWLRGLDVAGRTRDNYRDAGADNEVFSVEEAEKLLRGAPERLIPSLALKLFSGLRTEEMLLIRWEDIKFDQDVIFLTKDITKTKKRRLPPLLPNLKQWLLPYAQSTGTIAERWSSAQTLSRSWTRRADEVGVEYKKNAMRNSYVSYRLAIVKDIAQVALESGNSPGVLQENYLELVTEPEAKRWFSITPD